VPSITTKMFCTYEIRRLVNSRTKFDKKKGVIMLRNDTIYICHRLLCVK